MIYSVDPSTGVLNNRNLLTEVGICPLSLTGLGTAVLPGQYATARCSSFLDVNTGEPLGPLTTGHYFISILISPGLFGGPATFSVNDVPQFGVSNLKNYYLNAWLTDNNAMINVSPLAVTDSFGETWYWTGFGATLAPSIGVNFFTPDRVFSNGFETGQALPPP